MTDIIALGEMLIDFSPLPGEAYQAHAGGAPLNMLAAAAHMGRSCAIIAGVGRDHFGDFLLEQARIQGISTRWVQRSSRPSSLAIVSLNDEGERSFSFYRDAGADLDLREQELPVQDIQSCTIFHVGSLSLCGEPSRSTTFKALEAAHEAGCLISFDPNLRVHLWTDLDSARTLMHQVLEYSAILKLSAEELDFILGTTKQRLEAVQDVFDMAPHLQILALTLGSQGSILYTRHSSFNLPAFAVKAVDTTGAGDCYMGCLLAGILDSAQSLSDLSPEEWKKAGLMASAMAALSTTRPGGVSSIPSRESGEALLKGDVP